MADTLDDEDALTRELDTLAALQPLQLGLTRVESLLLLSLLQLALRHPDVEGAGRELGMRVALTLEDAVSVTPALRDLARRGWGDS